MIANQKAQWYPSLAAEAGALCAGHWQARQPQLISAPFPPTATARFAARFGQGGGPGFG